MANVYQDQDDIDRLGYRAWIRQVPCPSCGAASGQWCRTSTGHDKGLSHNPRGRLRWEVSRLAAAAERPT